ncbi:nucleolar RNA helicase 2-like [Saccostrea cucullata]|uniref:nucleolar RNA helicase 2-like n=1 Tax=Saccostrea cuccullata TaxID=36930 RepID=UPI002ED3E2F6
MVKVKVEDTVDKPIPKVKKVKEKSTKEKKKKDKDAKSEEKKKKNRKDSQMEENGTEEVATVIKEKKKSKKEKKTDGTSSREKDSDVKEKKKKSKKDEKSVVENGHGVDVDKIKSEPIDTDYRTNGETEKCLDEAKVKSEKTEGEILGDFSNFRISDATVQKLQKQNINYLFPIQYKTFNHIYDGEDVIGQARTGTGKTLSFALPLVEVLQKKRTQRIRNCPKVIVMVPTRELAKQVSDVFESIGEGLNVACFYGGTPYEKQMRAINSGIDVLVGTPGRIKDHIERGNLDFSRVRHVVLDEVDRMLDMGFAEDVETIISSAYKSVPRKFLELSIK